jgi:hypothetical protein
MIDTEREMQRRNFACGSLLVFFLLFVVILEKVTVFGDFRLFLFFVFIVVEIFGDDVEVNGMDLRHLELGFTLGATEDLAFFDFVFVDVDFGRTLGAADHGSILRRMNCRVGAAGIASTTVERYYIPRREKSIPGIGLAVRWATVGSNIGATFGGGVGRKA